MSCGSISSSLKICNWNPQKRRNKAGTEKNIWRNYGQINQSFMKTINPQIQETQQPPSTRNMGGGGDHNKATWLKTSKILKTTRVKRHMSYWGTKIRMINYFTLETMQIRKQYSNIFKVLKEKYCQAGTLCLVKIYFKMKAEIFFPDTQRLKELMTSRS